MLYHLTFNGFLSSDVVLETRDLVSRHLEDKNESLDIGLEKSVDYITASQIVYVV